MPVAKKAKLKQEFKDRSNKIRGLEELLETFDRDWFDRHSRSVRTTLNAVRAGVVAQFVHFAFHYRGCVGVEEAAELEIKAFASHYGWSFTEQQIARISVAQEMIRARKAALFEHLKTKSPT